MLDFSDAPRSPFVETPPSETLQAEVRDLRTIDVSRSKKIGYTLLNRSMIGEASPIVSIGGFLSDLTTPDRAWEGIRLATLDRPVLMLDMPGHGLSSPHTTEQIVDLCLKRSADKQAAPLTDAVALILNSEDSIDMFGISHGSLLSLKITEQLTGDRIRTVFGIDAPSVKRRWTLGLQLGYAVMDNVLGRREYIDALKKTPLWDDFERFKEDFEMTREVSAKSFMRNNTGLFILNLFASINARTESLDSWKSVLDNTSASVEIVSSGEGSVSDSQAIDHFISELPLDQQNRSNQIVIPDEDHNIGISHLIPRTVDWARVAYEKNLGIPKLS